MLFRRPHRAAVGHLVEVVVADARQEKTPCVAGSCHDDVAAVGGHDGEPKVRATRSVEHRRGKRRVACPGGHVCGRCVRDAGSGSPCTRLSSVRDCWIGLASRPLPACDRGPLGRGREWCTGDQSAVAERALRSCRPRGRRRGGDPVVRSWRAPFCDGHPGRSMISSTRGLERRDPPKGACGALAHRTATS